MSKTTLSFFLVLLIASFSFVPKSHFNLSPAVIHSTSDKQTSHDTVLTPVVFNEASLDWGLLVAHEQNSQGITGIDDILGGGACILDADGDGWDDVLLIGGSGERRFYGRAAWWAGHHSGNTLWRNVEGRYFENITQQAAIPTATHPMGCATGDLDNDGDTDVFITNHGTNQLLINQGNGTFVDGSENAGLLADDRWSTSAAIADYNGDGLADIYVSNFVTYQKGSKILEQSSGFIHSNQEHLNPERYDSQANYLYENLYKNVGSLHFKEHAIAKGVDDASGKGLAARWLDINDDNHLDLLVLNSRGTPNRLFINQGPSDNYRFLPATSNYRVESTNGSHSAAAADIDRDGNIDLVLSSSAGSPPKLLTQENQHHRQNVSDLTWELGLARNNWLYKTGWGVVLADFNNDNTVDIFTGNGAMTVAMDSHYVTVAQPDSLWLNQVGANMWGIKKNPSQAAFIAEKSVAKKMRFVPAAFSANVASPTRGVISADFNRDGKIDLLSTQNNGYVRLLINDTDTRQPWTGIKLDTAGSSATAGARIQIKINGKLVQEKTFFPDSSYLSQSADTLHFALPTATTVDILLHWPDGSSIRCDDLTIRHYWLFKQSGACVMLLQTSSSEKPSSIPSPSTQLWMTTLDLSADSSAQYELVRAIGTIGKQRLLANKKASTRVFEELMFGLTNGDRTLKKEILRASNQLPELMALRLIKHALNDSDETIRKASVTALAKQEHEISVGWLLTQVKDPHPSVRCEVARAFEFFFHEEEAVVKRKPLGVSMLVQLLDDDDTDVQLCAISALAEAESYRALKPLIRHLQDAEAATLVRASSARALGLLRNREATAELVTRVEQTQQTTEIITQSLIALKRLHYENFDELLRQTLSIELSDNSVHNLEKSFVIAQQLLSDPEGKAVLTQAHIVSHFTEALQDLQQSTLSNKRWVTPALHLLARTNRPDAEPLLLRYLAHHNPAIAKAALLSLAQTRLPKEGLSQWRFFSHNADTQIEALDYLLARAYQPSVADAERLLTNPATANQLMAAFHQQGYPYLLSLIGSSGDTRLSHSKTLALFKLCRQQDVINGQLESSWLQQAQLMEKDSDQRLAILACWVKTSTNLDGALTDSLATDSPPIFWLHSLVKSNDVAQQQLGLQALARHPKAQANRLLLEKIKGNHQNPTLRIMALKIAIEYNKPYALPLALHFAQQSHSPLKTQATSLLQTYGKTAAYHNFLAQRANDKHDAFQQRWNAIKLLVTQTDHTILDFL